MNTVDYSGRELMHEVAIYELSSLCDKVRGWKMDRNIGSMDNNDTKLGDEADVSVTHGIPINPQNNNTTTNKERKAIGMVEEPDTHKIALVVASGKALQKVENEIVNKTHDKLADWNKCLNLSESEVDNIVEFLKTLTGSNVNELILDAKAAPIGEISLDDPNWFHENKPKY